MDINNAINQLQQSSADLMEHYCVINGRKRSSRFYRQSNFSKLRDKK
jgi:hypothetical protein